MSDTIAKLTGAAPEAQAESLKNAELETVTPDLGESAEVFLGILETHLPVPELADAVLVTVSDEVVQTAALPQSGNPLPVAPLPVQAEPTAGPIPEDDFLERPRTEPVRLPTNLPGAATVRGERSPATAAVEPTLVRAGVETVVDATARPADSAVQAAAGSLERPAGDSPPLRSEIPVRVESPRWGDALANRVIWSVRGGNQSAELRLNPPELGPIEVKIALSNNEASITFGAQHAAVREAIELALPRLREMLGQNGVSLGDVNVSSHSREGGADDSGTREGRGSDAYDGPDGDVVGTEDGGGSRGHAGEGLIDHYA